MLTEQPSARLGLCKKMSALMSHRLCTELARRRWKTTNLLPHIEDVAKTALQLYEKAPLQQSCNLISCLHKRSCPFTMASYSSQWCLQWYGDLLDNQFTLLTVLACKRFVPSVSRTLPLPTNSFPTSYFLHCRNPAAFAGHSKTRALSRPYISLVAWERVRALNCRMLGEVGSQMTMAVLGPNCQAVLTSSPLGPC